MVDRDDSLKLVDSLEEFRGKIVFARLHRKGHVSLYDPHDMSFLLEIKSPHFPSILYGPIGFCLAFFLPKNDLLWLHFSGLLILALAISAIPKVLPNVIRFSSGQRFKFAKKSKGISKRLPFRRLGAQDDGHFICQIPDFEGEALLDCFRGLASDLNEQVGGDGLSMMAFRPFEKKYGLERSSESIGEEYQGYRITIHPRSFTLEPLHQTFPMWATPSDVPLWQQQTSQGVPFKSWDVAIDKAYSLFGERQAWGALFNRPFKSFLKKQLKGSALDEAYLFIGRTGGKQHLERLRWLKQNRSSQALMDAIAQLEHKLTLPEGMITMVETSGGDLSLVEQQRR